MNGLLAGPQPSGRRHAARSARLVQKGGGILLLSRRRCVWPFHGRRRNERGQAAPRLTSVSALGAAGRPDHANCPSSRKRVALALSLRSLCGDQDKSRAGQRLASRKDEPRASNRCRRPASWRPARLPGRSRVACRVSGLATAAGSGRPGARRAVLRSGSSLTVVGLAEGARAAGQCGKFSCFAVCFAVSLFPCRLWLGRNSRASRPVSSLWQIC